MLNKDIEIWVDITDSKKQTGNDFDVFQRGIIQSLDQKANQLTMVKINQDDGNESKAETLTCSLEKVYQTNQVSSEGFDDMVDMENLNEAELLYNIKKRYEKNEIFTYVGPTLLVVNPYQVISKVLAPETMNFYQTKVFEPEFDLKKIPPHVYALSGLSIRQLCESKRNQAIVISGESGAGKTENTKFAMKFLTSIGFFITKKYIIFYEKGKRLLENSENTEEHKNESAMKEEKIEDKVHIIIFFYNL